MKAVYLEDGIYTVMILDHRTLKHHGSCNVIDGLYEMTIMFVETFRYVTSNWGSVFIACHLEFSVFCFELVLYAGASIMS